MTMPELRFKSNELLREVSLSEVGNFYGGLSGKTKSDFGFGDSKFITYMNVFTNTIAKQDMCDLVMVGANEKQNLVVDGDILFTQSSETPEEVGMASVWSYKQKVYLNSFSFGLRVKNKQNVDPVYLTYLLRSPVYRKRISIQAQGISRYNLSSSRLSTLKVKIPTLEEQQKIAAFFIVIDRKLDILRKEKAFLEGARKGVVDGFFTRKMRLSESNDEWVQLTLGQVAEFYNGDRGKNYPSQKDYVNDGIPFINAGDLDGVSISNACVKITKEKYDSLGGAKIKQNDILYCLRGSLGKKAIVTINEGTIASSLITIRANKVNYKFLFYFLDSCLEDKQRKLNDEGAAQPNLSAKSLKSFSIPVPSLDEQEKIAEFLTCWDSKVEIVKRRIKSVEKLKLAFMQKMFV